MCEVCDYDIGHMDGCCLDGGCGGIVCSICGREIGPGDEFIYDMRDGCAVVCASCIEEFPLSDLLEICGYSSATELIAETTGKIFRAGETY